MSSVDAQRLMADLQTDSDLLDEFLALGSDIDGWVTLAASRGYSLTFEEAEGLSSSYEELSDDDLEEVAGGWSGNEGGP